jgi:hypothetical protein
MKDLFPLVSTPPPPRSTFSPLHSIACCIEHLFEAGMWVWVIAILAREILGRICLKDLWKATDADQYTKDFLASKNPDTVLPTSSSQTASSLLGVAIERHSPRLLRPHELSHTESPVPVVGIVRASPRLPKSHDLSSSVRSSAAVGIVRASPRLPKPHDLSSSVRSSAAETAVVGRRATPATSQRKPHKRQKRQTSNEGHHGPISSGNLEKMCGFVSHDLSESELEAVLNKAKCSPELFQFTKDLHYHMKWNIAYKRQKILTDQYLEVAICPGHASSNLWFFSNEFWYEQDEDANVSYFDKFEIKWSTEYVEVGLGRLFNTRHSFHLQMLKDYEMEQWGNHPAWHKATKAWRTDCSLDR